MSIPAALFETASYAGTRLSAAYGIGYGVGTVINSLWSTYSPQTYAASSDLLGSTVDSFTNSVANLLNGTAFDSISSAIRLEIGSLQASLFNSFIYGGPRAMYYSGGGDFGVSSPWAAYERMTCK